VVPIGEQFPADPVPILQRLIRFDTSNPPGNEGPCIAYVAGLLQAAGLQTHLLADRPQRPNLIARVAGRGLAPPLLLHAHIDVVPADGQSWLHPPFEGLIVDGEIVGRGAIDMKGELAMMLAAVLRLRAAGTAPAGDILLAVVADEESGSDAGAAFLVQSHPELFNGVRYAVGEDGGAALNMGGASRFYPVVVGEKRSCWMRATLHGPGGHASRAGDPHAATARLGRMLTALGCGQFGPCLTPAVDRMLAQLIPAVPKVLAGPLAKVRDNPGDETPLAKLPARDRQYLRAVLHHTVNPTVIRAGTRTNIIPSEITVELDGRLLPGDFETEDFIGDLQRLIGDDIELEILAESGHMLPSPLGPFYELLGDVLHQRDHEGVPVPMVTTASTDAQFFASLGMSCYGWMPLRLPPDTGYRDLLHCADERVPIDALRFGADCFHDLLRQYR